VEHQFGRGFRLAVDVVDSDSVPPPTDDPAGFWLGAVGIDSDSEELAQLAGATSRAIKAVTQPVVE